MSYYDPEIYNEAPEDDEIDRLEALADKLRKQYGGELKALHKTVKGHRGKIRENVRNAESFLVSILEQIKNNKAVFDGGRAVPVVMNFGPPPTTEELVRTMLRCVQIVGAQMDEEYVIWEQGDNEK